MSYLAPPGRITGVMEHSHGGSQCSLDLGLPISDVNFLMQERTGAPPIKPSLVEVGSLAPKKRIHYKRLQGMEKKEAFRRGLVDHLKRAWTTQLGAQKAEKLTREFLKLSEQDLKANGAVIFGALLKTEQFETLIHHYTHLLSKFGSKSLLHSYVNLGNHPKFLAKYYYFRK